MTKHTLSIVIPCFNEESTLRDCVDRVLEIQNKSLQLELIIVDDKSTDNSLSIAQDLASTHKEIKVLFHLENQGKGAALRTGFKEATGDFVAVQDADLEYNPQELLKLLEPLKDDRADVVLGSRFLHTGEHRVIYFWHSLGNRFLTFLSNMFTDLNLTDMETCYKVFKREVIQSIEIKENRFGFEPEIIAKVAQRRLRVYENSISYSSRTYEEGKKIGIKDGFRALFCIFHYNAPRAPLPIQFLIYLFIGGICAVFNLILFVLLMNASLPLSISAPVAFCSAAILNYFLCILFLFRHEAKWKTPAEIFIFLLLVGFIGWFDFFSTKTFIHWGTSAVMAKLLATGLGLILNFLGRKYLVFPEKPNGPWLPSSKK